MRSSTSLFSVLVASAVAVAACGGSSDVAETNPDADSAVEDSAAETSADADADADAGAADADAADADPNEPAPVNTAARDAGDGTSPDQAATLSGAPIEWTQEGATWSFDMDGLVQVDGRDEGDGGCLALFGTATAVDIGDRNWSGQVTNPAIELVVGDESISTSFGFNCDMAPAQKANHVEYADARLISGATISFAHHFPLGEFTIADVDAVVWRSPNDEREERYFLPTLIDAPPAATVSDVDYSRYPSTQLDEGQVRIGAGNVYDVQFQGVGTAPATERAQGFFGPGECQVIVGSATVAETRSGFAASGAPSIHVLVGGRHFANSATDCDTTAFNASGYHSILQTDLTVGTSIDFFFPVFVPDEFANSEMLVVTDANEADSALHFTPTLFDAPPTPLAVPDASVLPPTDGLMTEGPLTVDSFGDRVTIEFEGIVNAGPSSDGLATCFFVLGTMTADQEDVFTPRVSLISSGQDHLDQPFDCDRSVAEEAGWVPSDFIDFTPGEPMPFQELLVVPKADASGPQFVVIGLSGTDQPAILLDPVYLDAVPTP